MKTDSMIYYIVNNFRNYGNRTALKEADKSLTYNELLVKAFRFKKYLSENKVKSLGIYLSGKTNIIISVIGCLIQKIPFIILDTASPCVYILNIIHEAQIEKIIIDDYDIDSETDRININETGCIEDEADLNIHNTYDCETDDYTAFYISTSGSTGKPKIAERLLSAFWQDFFEIRDNFSYLFNQVAKQYAKLNFSYGFENTLILLLAGTSICFGNGSSSIKDIKSMYEDIEKDQATIVFWSSPIVKLLSKHHIMFDDFPASLKYIYTGGEPLVVSADFIVEMHNRNIVLINDYGCSEIGKLFSNPFNVSLRDMKQYNAVSVGKPLKGYKALILDENFNESEEGLLYLMSSSGFPCSYRDKSLQTNETENEKYPGMFLYNTCDIARNENGEIIILGREINSVNVSGYRIELEQIESCINAIAEVVSCIIIPHYNKYMEVTLCCFYSGNITPQSIRSKIRELLPSYMIPSAFEKVNEVFLFPNGKADRKKNYEVYSSYADSREVNVSEIKERVLLYFSEIMRTSIENLKNVYFSSFGEYGLESITLVDILSTIEEKENIKISVSDAGNGFKCIKDIVEIIIDKEKE